VRLILDANCLIYLVKSNLADFFIEITNDPVVIDKNVYEEVVEEGIKHGYPDANQISALLQKYNIPIIPVDVQTDLDKFKDHGETSCYLLAHQEGICITCDRRATKKFSLYGVLWMQLDNYFYQQYVNGVVSLKKIIDVIDKLETVYATTPERKIVFLKLIYGKEEK
jgi:hypothetical protein